MRQNLLNSFNELYHLNLHGNTRIKETIPDGLVDENVFRIQQGVSILLCVKKRHNPPPAKVYYADMWGNKKEKYETLSETGVQSTAWTKLQPTSPLYLFVPQDTERRAEYEHGWKMEDIFEIHGTGLITARDKLTIHQTPEVVRKVVADFVSLPEDKAREKYNLGKDSRAWQIAAAQADLRDHPDAKEHIAAVFYRPFDIRFTYYTGKAKGFHNTPAYKTLRHLLQKNLALCVCLQCQKPDMAARFDE